LALTCAAAALGFAGTAAAAQPGSPLAGIAVSGHELSDGTMSPAARASRDHGALPAGPADVAAKEAADRAYDEAKGAKSAAPSAADLAASGLAGPSAKAPFIAFSQSGQSNSNTTPPDTTGAVGPTRFIQLVNSTFAIYNRVAATPISQGSLDTLAGIGTSPNSFDPQIIWDATTNRFYYAMDSIFSATDNRISYGFSKTASPNTSSDWCKYTFLYGSEFPDYPKLGDSQFFVMIGADHYNSSSSFIGASLLAINKPPAGTTCPNSAAGHILKNLKDSGGTLVFSPDPANSIDTFGFGYAVARSLSVPSSKLPIFPVSRNSSTGNPSFLAVRSVTVPTYSIPPSARQPTFTQVIDTSDTRMQQAVMARNPARSGTPLSLWTQQTIANGTTGSQIQFYEIDPTFASPILRRSGTIASASGFLFNASISPDRRVDGGTSAFGGSFVIDYSVSRPANPPLVPRIVAGSSVNGAALTFQLVRNGTTAYRDFSCAGSGQRCRWGDYSGATPDPRPATAGKSAVWITNQLSTGGTSTAQANWATWIAAINP